jgi:transketolase
MTEPTYDCRDAFSATMMDLAATDPGLVVVVNDSVGSSKLTGFAAAFPDRLVNVGIAEQNLVGVAAGLENGGKTPFVSAAGSFLSARAIEQIKVDLAYSKRHVVLCAQSPGVGYGALGATHHSIEDVPWMRAIPGMTVLVPADPLETEQALRWAHQHDGPVYIRISRMRVPSVHDGTRRLKPGAAALLREGDDVTIIANGTAVHRALAAADVLSAWGLSARVLSMASVKPLDEDAVLDAAAETQGILTVEEGLIAGALAGAVAETTARRRPARVHGLGLPDAFAPTGSAEWLLDHFGMSAEGIAAAARELVS